MAIVKQIQSGKASGTVHIGPRALLGVQLRDTNVDPTSSSNGTGALIVAVTPKGPAASAGIKGNDVIISIAGKSVSSGNDVSQALAPYHPDDTVSVGWIDSSGKHRTGTVKLIEGPPA
jgi:S1-C subfamily serine protease